MKNEHILTPSVLALVALLHIGLMGLLAIGQARAGNGAAPEQGGCGIIANLADLYMEDPRRILNVFIKHLGAGEYDKWMPLYISC